MKKEEKGGLSPVIATVLLISMALVLAIIIFFWAKNFIDENVQKDGQEIGLLCDDVHFVAEASASSDQLFVENRGAIPIFAFEIKLKGEGEIKEIAGDSNKATLGPGKTANFSISNINQNEELIVVPVLLGETEDERVAKPCDSDYGMEIVVGI